MSASKKNRREFLKKSAKLVAYVAPTVYSFKVLGIPPTMVPALCKPQPHSQPIPCYNTGCNPVCTSVLCPNTSGVCPKPTSQVTCPKPTTIVCPKPTITVCPKPTSRVCPPYSFVEPPGPISRPPAWGVTDDPRIKSNQMFEQLRSNPYGGGISNPATDNEINKGGIANPQDLKGINKRK